MTHPTLHIRDGRPAIIEESEGDALLNVAGIALAAPHFEIDGERVSGALASATLSQPQRVFGQVDEYTFSGALVEKPDVTLSVIVRVAEGSPVVRFCYRLAGAGTLTSNNAIDYLRFSVPNASAIEWRFSEFSALFHSFLPADHPIHQRHFADNATLMGPMLRFTHDDQTALVAYEHGSEWPDMFIAFQLAPDRTATLKAVKGNTWRGQPVESWESVWFQVAIAPDEDALAHAYRRWVLRHLSPNSASRTPYVFYNTWNYQERVHGWKGQPYLFEMNEARMSAEIDMAHRMGIDVFVIDTGWYEKTGDWRASSARFPRGLAPIQEKLKGYGMKLGLWFNPTVAALSSEMRRRHEDCLMTQHGVPHAPQPIWETEASQGLSLVSRYWEAFADELIRLHREVGVSYFKWDAIGQYSSDAAGHFHGEAGNTEAERRDSYAFLLGRYMTKAVNKLCAACPDAIVDFDITEGGRTVGLEFLSAGKYFLINNGPYDHEYQVPPYPKTSLNLMFHPGPARAWMLRQAYDFDRWIPSVLFLAHYLPDDDFRTNWRLTDVAAGKNRAICLASLVLGHNGIWGDLLSISDEGIAEYGAVLARYKQMRDDITLADPVRYGQAGRTPEVHEKVNAESGRGVVCLFAGRRGRYPYITANRVAAQWWAMDGVSVTMDDAGHAIIDADFAQDEHAKLVFFGVN